MMLGLPFKKRITAEGEERHALNDPIADLLTRIRNARNARHRFVDFRPSKIKIDIVRVLHEQGYIDKFLVDEEKGKARFFLKYADGREPVIKG